MTTTTPAVQITLSPAHLNTDDATVLRDWAAFVAAHVDEACGVDAETVWDDSAGSDEVDCDDDAARERVTDWLARDGWDAFCAQS